MENDEVTLPPTRREMDAARGSRERLFQPPTALGLAKGAEVPLAFRQQVEGHEGGRHLRRQLADP
jgi:hypothetical protein